LRIYTQTNRKKNKRGEKEEGAGAPSKSEYLTFFVYEAIACCLRCASPINTIPRNMQARWIITGTMRLVKVG